MIRRRKVQEAFGESCSQCGNTSPEYTVGEWCEMDRVSTSNFCDYWECTPEESLCYTCYHRMRDEYESMDADRQSFQGYVGEGDPEGTFLENRGKKMLKRKSMKEAMVVNPSAYLEPYRKTIREEEEIDVSNLTPEESQSLLKFIIDTQASQNPEAFKDVLSQWALSKKQESRKARRCGFSSSMREGASRKRKSIKEGYFSEKDIEIQEQAAAWGKEDGVNEDYPLPKRTFADQLAEVFGIDLELAKNYYEDYRNAFESAAEDLNTRYAD